MLSGGERTRLAVARMLLRPSNTLLLDEPTNHLDLDSKDVLLDALEDYGGTLIIVSHDRYFVEKLATKIIEIGHGEAVVYPGTYTEFLWHKEHPDGIRDSATVQGPNWPKDRQGPTTRKPKAQGPKPRSPSPKPETRIPSPRGAQAAGGRARRRSSARPRRCRSGSPTSRAGSPSAKRKVKELEAAMASAGLLRGPGSARSRSSTGIRR